MKIVLFLERKKIIPVKAVINATSVNPGIVEPPNITAEVIPIKQAHNAAVVLLKTSLKTKNRKIVVINENSE